MAFIQILILLTVRVTLAIVSHQFKFGGTNIVYGHVPHTVNISGYWAIPHNDKIFEQLLQQYTVPQLMGHLYICTRNIEQKMYLINSDAENRKRARIEDHLRSQSFERFMPPYIDTTGCETLKTVDATINLKNNETHTVQQFNVVHIFTDHTPILFVDAFGVAAFHHRAKGSDMHNLLYCENEDATFPVIFNKRPVCPRPVVDTTKIDDGMVTIYKPNIVSTQKVAYHCFIKYTFIRTFTNFFGANTQNAPLAEKVKPIDPERCKRWIDTQTCDVEGLTFTHPMDFNATIVKLSDTRNSTLNKILIHYKWMFEYEYDIVNCIIDIGYIRVTPPFKSMVTAWETLSNEYLYKSNFTRAGGEVILWNPFVQEDLCNYVPMNSFDVRRITYETKDFLESDPHPHATELYHFVSDAEKSVMTSDDTQVSSPDKYNCISSEENQILYMISNGLILSWHEGVSIKDAVDLDKLQTDQVFHVHYGYNDLTKTINDKCNSSVCETIESVPGGGDGPETRACENCGSNNSSSNRTSKPNPKKVQLNTHDMVDTPLFNVVAYLQYTLEKLRDEETIRHAQAWCENQQHVYDNQLILARIVPSQIISSYLNRPVKSEFVGNGVFNTHYCETVSDFYVVDSLFVNNTAIVPKLGGKTYMELYKAAGVTTTRKNLCFVMPIIIFAYDTLLQTYRIGQLQHDQSISTVNMPFVEECIFGRQFIHIIKDYVHVFYNYRKISYTPLDTLYNHVARLSENDAYLKDLNDDIENHRPAIEPLLENTQFIDAYTKYEPTRTQLTFLRFENTDIYGYRTHLRVLTSLEDLIAYSNRARFDDGLLDSKIKGHMGDHVFVDLSDVGGGVKRLVGSVLNGVSTIFETGGSIIEKLGSSFNSIADFFTGGFLKVIIIIAAIAGLGFIVYLLIKHKLLSDDDEEDKYRPQYVTVPSQPQSYYHMYPHREDQLIQKRNNTFNNVDF